MADLEKMHTKAGEALSNGDNERAISLYKEIIAHFPEDEVAYTQLMDLYYDDDKMNYYLTRANMNITRNHLEHAINDCKKAIALDPSAPFPHHKLAKLLLATKRYLKAIDEYNRLLELEPNNYEAYMELISAYVKEDSLDSAIGVAKNALQIFPEKAELKNALAKLYFDLDDYENALSIVQDEILKTKILLQAGKNEEAKEILDKINLNALNQEQKLSYYILLAQYFYNTEKYNEAIETVDKYTSLNKGNTPLSFQMKALIYENMGDEFQSLIYWASLSKVQGKLEEAIMHFQNAEHINPQDKNVLIELANLYEQTKEHFVSMEYWKKVYEIDKDPQAGKILADFYYNEGDLATAEYYGKEIPKKDAPKEYSQSEVEDEGLIEKIIKLFSRK